MTAPSSTATGALEPIAPVAPASVVDALRTDPRAWDAFVAATPNGSFPQLHTWARANTVKDWRSMRLVARAPSGAVGAQVLIHRMRPGPWSRGYAARGPVAATFDAETVAAFTRAARETGRRLRLTHLVIDPELEAGHPVAGWLADEGWRHIGAIQIDRTRIVDLTRLEAALWSDLRSSARWSVNKARRTGHAVVEAGAAGLDDFERIYLETARRVGFEPGAAFRAVYTSFAADGEARLLLCRAPGGEAEAALVPIPCGRRVIEFYGASTTAGSRARANYLLKWEAIRTSRERGYEPYDMWGTDQEGPAESKAGFGGTEREYIGAWELVTDPRARTIVDLVRRTRAVVGRLAPGHRRASESA